MVFVKKWRFFNLKFLCKMDQEKVFFEGSDRKEALLEQKNIGSKEHQNMHFLKCLVHGFWGRNGGFLMFSFLCKMD